MKISLVVIAILLFSGISCKKNSNSKPKISIESMNTPIPVGGGLDAKLKFTQENGKLAKGTFVSIRNRLNIDQLPPGTVSADTIVGPIPDFPDKSKGEFEFTLDYNYLHQSDIENDTIQFKFAVIDSNGNSSDTITSGQIVVLFQ